MDSRYPVVVLGAGPVGLAAAVKLIRRKIPVLVLEQGAAAGASVSRWGHVRMFSPWKYNVDEDARELLSREGRQLPDPEAYPTGSELVDAYLRPLSEHAVLRRVIEYGTRVVSVSLLHQDRMKRYGSGPFLVRVRTEAGEGRRLARAVIDATGTHLNPNPLGAGGVPATGEEALEGTLLRGVPDVDGADRERLEGRSVLVVGSGDSAFNALGALVRARESGRIREIVWAIRGSGPAYGGGAADQLPGRGALGTRVREMVARGDVRLVTGFHVERIERAGRSGQVSVLGSGKTLQAGAVIAATGYRPDHAIAGELRLDLDPVTEAPRRLGPLIDPNLHGCGSVRPHGVRELAHPDAGYTIVGMKSYGRAPTFLLLTGYEQVRSVVASIAGDVEAAHDVRLDLPETGVCTGSPNGEPSAPFAETPDECCTASGQ